MKQSPYHSIKLSNIYQACTETYNRLSNSVNTTERRKETLEVDILKISVNTQGSDVLLNYKPHQHNGQGNMHGR